MEPGSVAEITPGDVVVVIPAHNEAERIGATVRAARTLPGVSTVLVVDDGSRDGTGQAAVVQQATVVTLKRNKGKGAAMSRGVLAAHRLDRDGGARWSYILFLDADLGETGSNAGPLIEAVHSGGLAMAIAAPPPQPGGGHGFVVRLARKGIRNACGFDAKVPLSGQRCLAREALAKAQPLAWRFGVEVGLTIDLVRAGYAVAEIPVDVRHRVTGADIAGQLHRARQYRDVTLALLSRRVRRSRRRKASHPSR